MLSDTVMQGVDFKKRRNSMCDDGMSSVRGKRQDSKEIDCWPQAPHFPYRALPNSNRKQSLDSDLSSEERSKRENWNIPSGEIQLSQTKLGEGSTSDVYAAVWNGKDLALKIQRSRRFSAIFEKEIHMAHRIGSHPCLVNMVGICTDLDARIICYDLQDPGTLDDVLDCQVENSLSPAERMSESLSWMGDVLSALQHLHTMDTPIVHRDVKPGNLFFSIGRKSLRLGDFGLCKSLSAVADEEPLEPVGSFRYMAPEALLCQNRVDEKVDIWAAGLVMWACAVRSRPFDALDDQATAQLLAMHGLLLPIECVPHAGLQNLIRSALDCQPEKRPSAQEMLRELEQMRVDGYPHLCAPSTWTGVGQILRCSST